MFAICNSTFFPSSMQRFYSLTAHICFKLMIRDREEKWRKCVNDLSRKKPGACFAGSTRHYLSYFLSFSAELAETVEQTQQSDSPIRESWKNSWQINNSLCLIFTVILFIQSILRFFLTLRFCCFFTIFHIFPSNARPRKTYIDR